jgi:ligand-binding sensor domain-containing protein
MVNEFGTKYFCPSMRGSSYRIKKLAADSAGCVWAAMDYCIARYNGSRWDFFSAKDGMASNIIRSITVDREGTVWVGGNATLSGFNGSEWSYHDIPLMHDTDVENIAVDQENIKWLSYNSGIIRFDGKTSTRYRGGRRGALDRATHITIGKKDSKWVSTLGRGILKFKKVVKSSLVVTAERLRKASSAGTDIILASR